AGPQLLSRHLEAFAGHKQGAARGLISAASARQPTRIPGVESARSHNEKIILDGAARSSNGFVQGPAPAIFATDALVRAILSAGA
ncbi:MAG TPA: hypothetical protein VMR25_18790, partial [Planctomycetaceae bacterium]|nr:hypothetical protein [Planctomycetaceae bacterium]